VVIEADPVLEKMARQLGARTEEIDAPFEPEAGAYGEHGYHGHHAEESDANASLGEQLSIEAHRRRAGGPPA
jgi:urease accessory protein